MNNLKTLGLLRNTTPQPARVVAPAPRATRAVSVEEMAHVTRLLGALLNVENSAKFLAAGPNFSGMLRADLHSIGKLAALVNGRMNAEFTASDTAVIDTLNSCGNLLDRLTILVCHCPPDVAEAAANAAADVIQQWHTPPAPRKARRTITK